MYQYPSSQTRPSVVGVVQQFTQHYTLQEASNCLEEMFGVIVESFLMEQAPPPKRLMFYQTHRLCVKLLEILACELPEVA
ncbi:MAG: hypothetical protein U0Y10_17590 [Spirosomataceae bacterium]